VIADPERVFKNTLPLLKEDGYYVIFDQYIPGFILPDLPLINRARVGSSSSAALSPAKQNGLEIFSSQ